MQKSSHRIAKQKIQAKTNEEEFALYQLKFEVSNQSTDANKSCTNLHNNVHTNNHSAERRQGADKNASKIQNNQKSQSSGKLTSNQSSNLQADHRSAEQDVVRCRQQFIKNHSASNCKTKTRTSNQSSEVHNRIQLESQSNNLRANNFSRTAERRTM